MSINIENIFGLFTSYDELDNGGDTVFFDFKIPTIASGSTVLWPWMGSSWVVLWTLWYSWASLYASWETNIIQGWDIGNSLYELSSRIGTTNSWSSMQFIDFYTDSTYLGLWWSRCAPYNCTLKLSMIRPILTADGVSLPFLEYKITFNRPVPAQFMVLDATAYSYGFQRTKTVRIPQITTNTALDFAVLQ